MSQRNFVPVERPQHRVSMDTFLQDKATACVLDGRGHSAYVGTADDDLSGHIPGAINLPYSQVLDENTGLFHDQVTLASVFDRKAPGWRDQSIVSSCGAGYSGTVRMLALLQLGEDSSFFDDSFSVWEQDPSRPTVRGENAE